MVLEAFFFSEVACILQGKNPGSLPLSELQKVSATPSHLTESKTSADQKQLREIKDSFEYIASNVSKPSNV